MVVLPDILEIFKNELKVIHSPENGADLISTERDSEHCLDEIQSLLVKYKVDAAQERLTEYRKQYHPKVH